MTLLIDPRAGSINLAKPLKRLGLPVTVERMSFADVSFFGKGEEGVPIPIGIEYKRLGDALQCMGDSRFTGHQLPGLRDCYEDVYLLIEGEWRPNSHGDLLVKRGKRWGPLPGKGRRQISFARFQKWQFSLTIRGGVTVITTRSFLETCIVIKSLYEWWTTVPLEFHKSHIQTSLKRGFVDKKALVPAPTEVRMLAQIPGMSGEKARKVLAAYATLHCALDAFSKGGRWLRGVPGVGKTITQNANDALHRRY